MELLRQIVGTNKVVDSKLLNLLGVQVQRTLAARLIYNTRRVSVDKAVKDKVDEIRREGIVLLPDFLPPDHFEGVRREYLPLLDQNADKLTVYNTGQTPMNLLTSKTSTRACCPIPTNF